MLGFLRVQGPHDLPHERNGERSHRQLADAHPDQDRHSDGVRRQLAAHGAPDLGRSRCITGSPYLRKHRWVECVVRRRDPLVLAVHRQHVLHQIVRAYREEVDSGRDVIRDRYRRRRFDHYAERGQLRESQPFTLLSQDRARLIKLVHRGEHGDQDAEIAWSVRAQDRPQLGRKHILPVQQETDGSPPELRVALLHSLAREGLVSAHVEGADAHGIGRNPLRHVSVNTGLLVLVREAS